MQRQEAMKYNGNQKIAGRSLHGYTSRCGALIDETTNEVIVGCGTALADIHYHCQHCTEPEDVDMDEGEHPEQ